MFTRTIFTWSYFIPPDPQEFQHSGTPKFPITPLVNTDNNFIEYLWLQQLSCCFCWRRCCTECAYGEGGVCQVRPGRTESLLKSCCSTPPHRSAPDSPPSLWSSYTWTARPPCDTCSTGAFLHRPKQLCATTSYSFFRKLQLSHSKNIVKLS